MNTIYGESSLPAAARSDAVSDFLIPDTTEIELDCVSGRIGVPLDAEAAARLERFRDLLLDRGARFNLTAIRDPDEIDRRLFLDALAMVPALDQVVNRQRSETGGIVQLVDVGSGAGFPGLVLKIVRPSLDVTLIDATAKKVGFLNDVITDLGLEHVRAVHGRAEDLGQSPAFRAQFDVATARAVAALPVLLEYVVPFLKTGGTALMPKGLEISEELRLGGHAASRIGAEIISTVRLPVGATRLVMARKSIATPTVYPRRPGIPTRGPLGERR